MILRAAIISIGLLLAGCAATPTTTETADAGLDTRLASVAFLTGSWVRENGDRRAEEHWTEPRSGSMFGVARTMRSDTTRGFEHLRIMIDDEGIVLLASPGGRHPATPFRLVGSGPGFVAFENPEHDFPQRISYRLDGDDLIGQISGDDGGETQTIDFPYTRDR